MKGYIVERLSECTGCFSANTPNAIKPAKRHNWSIHCA